MHSILLGFIFYSILSPALSRSVLIALSKSYFNPEFRSVFLKTLAPNRFVFRIFLYKLDALPDILLWTNNEPMFLEIIFRSLTQKYCRRM